MPATMAKKPRKDAPKKQQPAAPSEPTAGKDRHKNLAIAYRPDAETRKVLEALAKTEKRTVTNLVVVLVEEALRHRGVWPSSSEVKE